MSSPTGAPAWPKILWRYRDNVTTGQGCAALAGSAHPQNRLLPATSQAHSQFGSRPAPLPAPAASTHSAATLLLQVRAHMRAHRTKLGAAHRPAATHRKTKGGAASAAADAACCCVCLYRLVGVKARPSSAPAVGVCDRRIFGERCPPTLMWAMASGRPPPLLPFSSPAHGHGPSVPRPAAVSVAAGSSSSSSSPLG